MAAIFGDHIGQMRGADPHGFSERIADAVSSAARGIGAAQHLLVADDLAAGRLVRVLPSYEVEATEMFLAYPSAKFMRPVVRAFIDALVPALRRIDGIVA